MSPRVLFLHGFAGSPRSWQPVLSAFSQGQLEVEIPTLAGHHGTAPPRDFQHELERLAALLEPHADWIVCGYSLGARLALGLLQHDRSRLRAAVLIGVHPGLESEAERAARRRDDERWASLIEAQGTAAFAEAWAKQPLFESQLDLPAALRAEQRRIREDHDAPGLAAGLRALGLARMPSYWSALDRIALPVELVTGERDTKFRALAERALPRLSRGAVRVVPGAGHNVVLERPEAVCDAIRAVAHAA